MSANPTRVPAGVRTGGRFAATQHSEHPELPDSAGRGSVCDSGWIPDGVTPHPTGGYVTVKGSASGFQFLNAEGKLHRLDGPAVEGLDGSFQWWVDDKRHRLDGPAIEWSDGTREWWVDDKRHRLDGPAVENADGTRKWYLNGRLNRLGAPAVERPDGSRLWCTNGKRHRLDGPAVERADGSREWRVHGLLHRFDGPAVERADGTREWRIDGWPLTETKHAETVARMRETGEAPAPADS